MKTLYNKTIYMDDSMAKSHSQLRARYYNNFVIL